jgi:hypothetical protein
MKKRGIGVVVSGIALVGVSLPVLHRAEAQGPAANGAPANPSTQAAAPQASSAAADKAKLVQENYLAIQRIAAANRESDPILKKIFEDMDAQSKSFRASVDEQVIAKTPEGAALVKKDRALSKSIDELTKTLKEKQQERMTVLQKRSEMMAKSISNPEFQALSKANAEATKALQDKLLAQVEKVSPEGKRLVDERATLLAPPAKPAAPVAPVSAAK